jgi:diguanylate cyclase (GGDEF)-like protein
MWRHRSLIYPAAFFFLVAVAATLGVGYFINYSILEDVLRQRMTTNASQVASSIRQGVEEKMTRMERFKNSWVANADWMTNPQDPPIFGDRLRELFPLWPLDFLILLEPQGNVAQALPKNFSLTHPIPPVLMGKAKDQLRQAPHWWSAGMVDGQWHLLLFAALPALPEQAPRLLVFGHRLEKLAAQLRKESPDTPFLLATSGGIINGELPSDQTWKALRDPIAQVLDGPPGTTRIRFELRHTWGWHFSALPIAGNRFALIVPVPLDEARTILVNSRQRLALSGLGIIALLLLLGWGVERMILSPLRRLRDQAALLVEACSVDEDHPFEAPQGGNEIALLDRAFQEASIKLYAHVVNLADTKQLLESLALKDPVTLLGNRRMFDEFLGRTLGHCRRKNREVMIVLIHPGVLDNPSSTLNLSDRNRLLQILANRLRDHLRGEDLAFRIEDSEFVAFAPECGEVDQVRTIANRLRDLLAESCPLADGRLVSLEARMGISLFPDAGDNVETLLEAARAALEKTKKNQTSFEIIKVWQKP